MELEADKLTAADAPIGTRITFDVVWGINDPSRAPIHYVFEKVEPTRRPLKVWKCIEGAAYNVERQDWTDDLIQRFMHTYDNPRWTVPDTVIRNLDRWGA